MTIEEYFNHLICVICQAKLVRQGDGLVCTGCNKYYKKSGDKIFFSEYTESEISFLDALKKVFKRYPKLYVFLVEVFSPVLFQRFMNEWPEKLSQKLNTNDLRLNLGAGNTVPMRNFLNIDAIPYDNVSIVCDIGKLPFNDESVSLVVLNAVLEHVSDDRQVIDEVTRVLCGGGHVCCAYPFMQGFHASPFDYCRRTSEGLKRLFAGYEVVVLCPYGGPTSGLLWIFQEWIALVFSLGFKRVYNIIYPIIMLLTFPIKYFDLLLIKHQLSGQISSGFYIVAKKI